MESLPTRDPSTIITPINRDAIPAILLILFLLFTDNSFFMKYLKNFQNHNDLSQDPLIPDSGIICRISDARKTVQSRNALQ